MIMNTVNNPEITPVERKRSRFNMKLLLTQYNTILIFVVLAVVSSLLNESFFTGQNIANLLRQEIPYVCIALGMITVMVAGGVDLAAGSTVAVGGMVFTLALTKWGFTGYGGLIGAILVVLVMGAVIGLLTSFFVNYFHLVPFVATLAFQTIYRGVTYMLCQGQPIRLEDTNVGAKFWVTMGSTADPLIGIPWAVIITGVFVVLFVLIFKYTAFGRLLIATGSNEEAVRLSGISTANYKTASYMICSTMCVIAGMLMVARSAIANATAAVSYEFDAVTGCLIGGASLAGGRGNVLMIVIGTLILGLITNIMNLMSIAAYPQQVVKGMIILAAVIMQVLTEKSSKAE